MKKVYLTTDQVMQKLKVTRMTLHRWTHKGLIPKPAKIGNRLFWDEDALESVLKPKSKAA